MSICHRRLATPLGELIAVGDGDTVSGLYFERDGIPSGFGVEAEHGFTALHTQLDEYFAGRRRSFDLGLRLEGSPFQREVWEQLTEIPYGQTISYGRLAEAIGRPGQARRVGGAIARNPIAIIVPCHRVIGADGGLTGYAGGLERKRSLLELEAGVIPLSARPAA